MQPEELLVASCGVVAWTAVSFDHAGAQRASTAVTLIPPSTPDEGSPYGRNMSPPCATSPSRA